MPFRTSICLEASPSRTIAIAVPIILADGAVFHSIGMTGPLQRIMGEQLPGQLAALNDTAAALGKVLSIGERIRTR